MYSQEEKAYEERKVSHFYELMEYLQDKLNEDKFDEFRNMLEKALFDSVDFPCGPLKGLSESQKAELLEKVLGHLNQWRGIPAEKLVIESEYEYFNSFDDWENARIEIDQFAYAVKWIDKLLLDAADLAKAGFWQSSIEVLDAILAAPIRVEGAFCDNNSGDEWLYAYTEFMGDKYTMVENGIYATLLSMLKDNSVSSRQQASITFRLVESWSIGLCWIGECICRSHGLLKYSDSFLLGYLQEVCENGLKWDTDLKYVYSVIQQLLSDPASKEQAKEIFQRVHEPVGKRASDGAKL